MNKFFSAVLCAVLLSSSTLAAPAAVSSLSSSATVSSASSIAVTGTSSSSAESASPTLAYASDDPNDVEWDPETAQGAPQPIRGALGGTILGPQNPAIDIQNPDILAPPTTDAGNVYVSVCQ